MQDYSQTNNRAGRYVAQPTGGRAFMPEPLPPARPPLRIDTELQALLSRADLALGRLGGSIQTLPNPELFVLMYVRKEAVLSSRIEGTQSSLQDLLAAEAKGRARHNPDLNEVMNYVRAMNYGLERLKEMPISLRLIREIHAILMDGVRGSNLRPGEFRTDQNWVGPTGCTLDEAVHVPPPPGRIAEDMSNLEGFIHATAELPLLIRVGLVHAQFETIHPFLDGNGRMGRLLITFMLCEQKVLPKPVLYLSHYFERHRKQYYDGLQAVRDLGSWERWLDFFLNGVLEVSGQASDTARRILELREKHRRVITDVFGRAAGNGHRILDHLYERPMVSVTEVQRLIGTSYAAANSLVARLTGHGVLQEVTGQERNRIFKYKDYIGLFDEPDARA